MRSVRTLASQGRSLPVLVLAVLLIDSLGEELIFHPDWGFDSYEVTIPKRLSFRGGEQGVASPVSYLLQLKGKKHVLHLWPKRLLLPRHLHVFSFTKEGNLLEDHPYIPKDCNYMGLVEGSQGSQATFSSCMGGLRGILNIDAKHYQIEPLKTSFSFEHVVYLLKKEHLSNQTCGLPDDEIEQQIAQHENMARLRDFHISYMHPKYMELALVFDHSRYLYVKSNLTQVISDAILLSGIMDTYFKEINMRIHLKAVEIWTDEDKITIDVTNLVHVLNQFIVYKRNILNDRIPSDWSHLYVRRNFPDALGWAPVGKMCSELYGGSTSVFPDLNVLAPGTWSTHELGHGLGMKHDELHCQCKGEHSCIMGSGRTGWSNCSFVNYFKFAYSEASCLNNIPGISYLVRSCGNKIVEENEECDCGSREDCLKDRCCQSNCRLKRGANCSIGLCCHECRFRPSGYMCRQEENECDLAEYCNGNSSNCPKDTYKQDGTPCKYKARCFRKGCRSRFMQCQSIFGPDAKQAPNQCYLSVLSVAFVRLDICAGRKKMNVILQSTAMGIQVTAQRTLISRMERHANIKPVVSGRDADLDLCSAKAFLDLMPSRLLISAMMQLI
ncbi:Disintegrin and metalloproteinase domain-containing protein 30 [Tupaia chinensis]|uniref:Disintegrin and metalloproteinase domain-containing protein 30 n=1 Tax=Tupaia chinensis TaxID=246437 RepID=L8Y5H6_TUPCH|nr:Disintegrin and metalloproteinase domain-containing protein 30 [Tupaia chinensis]